MSGDLWMPGAERQPESNGGSMVGGPARAVWHITWDSLGAGGKQPAFDAVANYLRSADYAPHLMWDPWTGKIVQFYPANQSARALAHPSGSAETNRMGRACIQIEIFFSPGAVRDGKKYMTVADTPCKGLGQIMAWLQSWGIPSAWPSGWPAWDDNPRSVTNWKTKAGHYGHCHVPGNTHTDPGPMPRTMFEEDNVPLNTDDAKTLWTTDGIVDNPVADPKNPKVKPGWLLTDTNRQVHQVALMVAALGKQTVDVDEAAIVQGVLAGLAPDQLATHIADALGPQVAADVLDALKARLDA